MRLLSMVRLINYFIDNIETVNIAQVFGKLLNAIEHRGQYHAFALDGKAN